MGRCLSMGLMPSMLTCQSESEAQGGGPRRVQGHGANCKATAGNVHVGIVPCCGSRWHMHTYTYGGRARAPDSKLSGQRAGPCSKLQLVNYICIHTRHCEGSCHCGRQGRLFRTVYSHLIRIHIPVLAKSKTRPFW